MRPSVLVTLLLLSAGVAFAQSEGARISGGVTDPPDSVIVGAECTITNIETNASTTATTNAEGIYVIPDLRPGTYRLTIQTDGFRTVVQPSLQLCVQDAINENFKLAVGSLSDTATVVDKAPLLQTGSAAWNADFMKYDPKDSLGNMSVRELLLTQSEMRKCGFVDPPRPEDSNHDQTETCLFLQGLYSNEIAVRAVDFITRHKM
jgi:hypothetical protein